MKYQIYLNKTTSQFINKLADKEGKPSATIIKSLVEAFVALSKPVEDKILKEVAQNGGTEPRKG